MSLTTTRLTRVWTSALPVALRACLPHGPFPLAYSPQNLRIEILNPNDMVGYTWSRTAYRKLQFLFYRPVPDGPSGALRGQVHALASRRYR